MLVQDIKDVRKAMAAYRTFEVVSCHGLQVPISRRLAKEYLMQCLKLDFHRDILIQYLESAPDTGIINDGG